MSSDRERHELDEYADLVERAAAFEQEVIAEAQAETGPEDVLLVERAFATESGEARPQHGSSARSRIWPWLGAVLATAAAVLFWFDGRAHDRLDRGPSGMTLDQGVLELMNPVGTVQDYGMIEWSYPAFEGTTFEVRVIDPATGRVLFEERVEGRAYLPPDPTVSSGWPERIRIELRALDADGRELASSSSQASLSR